MQHTKEPWPEPQADTLETYTIDGVGFFDSYADAERARACVNACAWIDDVGAVPKLMRQPTPEDIIAMMRGLATDAERREVLREFCHSCGCIYPACQCWNDE